MAMARTTLSLQPQVLRVTLSQRAFQHYGRLSLSELSHENSLGFGMSLSNVIIIWVTLHGPELRFVILFITRPASCLAQYAFLHLLGQSGHAITSSVGPKISG